MAPQIIGGLRSGEAALLPVQVGDDAPGWLGEILRKVDLVRLQDQPGPSRG